MGSYGKPVVSRNMLATALMAWAVIVYSGTVGLALAQTLPSGGDVVAGSGTISSSGAEMIVHQFSDAMITDWQSFSIGKDATVRFVQPDSGSVALNRVVGADPSTILGSLTANGHVFLVNPSGIVFGHGARIDTRGLVASTLDLANEAFLADRYEFSGTGGSVRNQGELRGRVVALIGTDVRNEGYISGDTAMAAGTAVTLDFDGDGLIGVRVDAATVGTLVENGGLITADGGLAVMTARGAGEALRGVVNNSGSIEARRIAEQDGRILLLGDMAYGEVQAGGNLTAALVETSAADVRVDEALVVDTQGGEWLIDPVDITIDETLAGAIETALGSGNVTISTDTSGEGTADHPDTGAHESGSHGDIFVNAPITWNKNILTLRADRHIRIGAELTSRGNSSSDGLSLVYGQSDSSGDYFVDSKANLSAGSHFSTKKGTDPLLIYTVITELGHAGSHGDGTLQGILGNLQGRYVLGADIHAYGTEDWNGGKGFTPIGKTYPFPDQNFRFSGTFDGLGHTITGLTVNQGVLEVGLFGYVDVAGLVQNVGLVDVRVDASSVSDTSVATGALVGRNHGTVRNSYATGTVIGSLADWGQVGGLVGRLDDNGIVETSYAAASVTGGRYFGGLVGYIQSGTVQRSYAAGFVEGDRGTAGGLVGYIWDGTVRDSYATGSVESNDSNGSAGGLVGSLISGSVEDSFATGSVKGFFVGGLIASVQDGSVARSFYLDRGGSTHQSAVPKSEAELKDPFTFIDAGWDFENVWGKSKSGENDGYMVFRQFSAGAYDYYVRIASSEKTYGDANPSLASLVAGAVGFDPTTLSWGGAVMGKAHAGTYAYSTNDVLSFGVGDHSDYYVDGAAGLTIRPRKLTVRVNDVTKTYDGLAFNGGNGVTYDGFVSGEDEGVLGGTILYGGDSQGAVDAGDYTITVSGLTSNNYTITYEEGALRIDRAALTITANDAIKTYDGLTFNGGNGVTYDGFVTGDDESVLGGTLV